MYIHIVEILAIIIAVILFFWVRSRKNAEKEGRLLDPVLQPYYTKVFVQLSPYESTEFAKAALPRLRETLEFLWGIYQNEEQKKDPPKNAQKDPLYCLAKIMFDASADAGIAYCFAYMYILTIKHPGPLWPGEEVSYALDALKDRCIDKLKSFDDIPECMWIFFDLDKKRYMDTPTQGE